MGCLHRVGQGGDTIGINTEEIVASPTPEEKIPDSLGVCAAKTRISRIDPQVIIAADPSEAVRSDEINGLLKQYFTVVEARGTGGAILFRLLDGIAHNFDPQCHEHNRILSALCAFEENLTRKHLLPDIFKVYVLRNDKQA